MTVQDPIRTVIWGQPGVGKTTLAARFPKPWFIDIEKSTAWMRELRSRQWERPKTWDEIMAQIERFKRELPGETLVIDSIDWLEAKYIEKFGAPGGGDDWGKSYNAMDKIFRKLLDNLTEISEKGVHIVLTAHFQIKEQSDPDQVAQYSKYVLKMQKKTCSAVMEWADEILFIRFRDTVLGANRDGKGGKAVGGQIRDIKTVRAAAYDAKNRFDLPEEMEFKADKQLPEPLRTLIWDGYDRYLEVTGQIQPLANPEPVKIPEPVQANSNPVPMPQQVPVPGPQPTPRPEPKPAPQPVQTAPVQADKRINPTLAALMERDGILAGEIESLVRERGFLRGVVPDDAHLQDYPPDFVEAMLIQQWEKCKEFIRPLSLDDDNLPF